MSPRVRDAQTKGRSIMKHCISIKPGFGYGQILSLVSREDESIEAREFTPEVDGNGNSYSLLTLVGRDEISQETERKVDRLKNVLASTFNIDEEA